MHFDNKIISMINEQGEFVRGTQPSQTPPQNSTPNNNSGGGDNEIGGWIIIIIIVIIFFAMCGNR